jgi:hypothetical protein
MVSLDRWVEHLQERDAVCAAMLTLAEATKISVMHRPGQFEEDLDDPRVSDARVQLAQLIEDPAMASAIAHALQILCRQWETKGHGTAQATPDALVFFTSFPDTK